MSITWADIVQITVGTGRVVLKVVCNNQSGYTLLPPQMEVIEKIDGCNPPSQIIVDKVGVYQTADYKQVETMLYRIYSQTVKNPIPRNRVQLINGFPSNSGLMF